MWERNVGWLTSPCTLTGDQTCNPGMCPDLESNQQNFGLWDDTQPSEPHWSGFNLFLDFFSPIHFFNQN